ncbi:MAG: long-chain fatty acid--CoA ligase [Alphaproteobacteria bacterium]|nr:long-chain fatty acid--CoA ligase [Alphaproteobacteria bacterium]
MRGMMSEQPLLISMLIRHAARFHSDTEIVARLVDGSVHRYTYAAAEQRCRRLAQALIRLGVEPGDRVATLAWNTHRHLELYYAVSGVGAVCHTINPRLFDDQIVYIINHARDRLVFVESSFIPLVERLRPLLPPDTRYVLLEPAETSLPLAGLHDALIDAEDGDYVWPDLDERFAAALCYTSGTTGRPKGALYSHRSTVLHAFGLASPDATSMSARDVVCPVVPMFHACAWGVPYAAAMNGTKLVLPGPRLDGASLYELFEAEGVTLALGVPTIWLGFEAHLTANKLTCSSLNRILSGGSAVPLSLIDAFENRHKISVIQGWGMTEMSPLGTAAVPKAHQLGLDNAATLAIKAKAGRPVFGVEMKIVGEGGVEQPHDGESVGELLVRGPFIISGYFEDPEATEAAVEADGWFHTGDVAAIDRDGFLHLTDRRKDIIKSGGEWISSIELETAAMAHEDVAEAAAIAIPHPKWAERPLLIVTPRPGRAPQRDALIAFLSERFPRWMLPDDVLVIEELPHTATGKIMKTRLRELYGAHRPAAW